MTETPPRSTRAGKSFARDLFVNVLANLIAAAIIYLGAVVGGYLRPHVGIVATALSVLGSTGMWFFQKRTLRSHPDPSTADWVGFVFFAVLCVASLITILVWMIHIFLNLEPGPLPSR
ncbi:hypothetical protein [Micromonospora sp. NPDC023644]|uniref:hypothetical protein n=1 Tax=Micromonospora sp. NPDC023644 TaxID=3154321 RepID=UPI0033CE7420